jgi:hypothetical protein
MGHGRECKAVTPTPKIRPEVHRRFECVLARVVAREEQERARLAALPKLSGRQREKIRTEETGQGGERWLTRASSSSSAPKMRESARAPHRVSLIASPAVPDR